MAKVKVRGETYGGYSWSAREIDTEAPLTKAQRRYLKEATHPVPDDYKGARREGEISSRSAPWYLIAALHVSGHIEDRPRLEGKDREAHQDKIDRLVDEARVLLRDDDETWPEAHQILGEALSLRQDLERRAWIITDKGRAAVA